MSHLHFVMKSLKSFLRNPWQPFAETWMKNTGLDKPGENNKPF